MPQEELWQTYPSDDWYRDEARLRYEDINGCVIDEQATVSRSPHGAYIACWVWVDCPDMDDEDPPDELP